MKKTLMTSIFVLGLMIIGIGLRAQTTSATIELKQKIIDLNDPEYANLTFDDILAKYRGKVIYLDFWASWCSPCKREMPHSLKLQETFAGKDVVFVYISSDKTADPWKAAIDRLGLTGELYRANYEVKMDYATRFNVRYIPRYILIDKKGNVADDNAKRPSNPNVVKDINALL